MRPAACALATAIAAAASAVGASLAAVQPQAGVPTDWVLGAAELEQLARGEVLVIADLEGRHGEVQASAAVQIAASSERIFRTMTDCAQALEFVPHLEVCRVLESAPDGSWQLIEHAIDLSWYLPRTDYVFRAEYERYRSIRFTHVRGDLRENRGIWELRPVGEPGTAATILTYRVHVVPRFFTPRWVVRASLRRDLPRMLRALRERCEEGAKQAGASAPERAPRLESSASNRGRLTRL